MLDRLRSAFAKRAALAWCIEIFIRLPSKGEGEFYG
jgi:hypothetical protein